ncbi:MAG: hypothetical protein WCO54_03550 [Bacteroidota bacterium]
MKKFLTYSAFFILPLLVLCLLLFAIPYSREFAYMSKNNQDCNTSWIYHRLFKNDTKIDIAFIGTSHTGCAINDELIEQNLDSFTHVANLAYCGGGRNLDLILLNDIIDSKSPSVLFIEIKNNNAIKHRDYGIMAPAIDLWFPVSITPDYLINLYTGGKSRLDFLRDQLFFGSKTEIDVQYDSNGKMQKKTEYMYMQPHIKKKKVIVTIDEKRDHNFMPYFKDTISEDLLLRHMNVKEEICFDDVAYLEKMCALAKSKHIKVYLLYLPPYGNYMRDVINQSSYPKIGTVIFPPDDIYSNKNYWIDGEHLNLAGANVLSKWISKKIPDLK